MNVLIRNAEAQDAPQLSRLAVASKRYWNYPDTWIELWKSYFEVTPEYISSNPVWIAIHEDTLLGFAAIKVNQSNAELEHMWISPDYINHGVGKILLMNVLKYCRTGNIRQLRIESDPNAKSFYEKMGAKHVGYVDSIPRPRKLPVLVIDLQA